jgi:thiamine-phosphate pyrophosphorylase
MADDEIRTQIVLMMSARAGSAAALHANAKVAVDAAPVATIVLEIDPTEPMPTPELALAVEQIQALGIATLVFGDAALARVVKADGLHVPASKSIATDYREARDILGTRFIVGVDVGRTRHDAMTLGEEGADYIAFGIPPHVEDRATARARRLELISWWSEIFEIPCVAFDVETPDEAQALAAAGADFIAVRVPAELPESGVAAFVMPFAGATSASVPAA